ncbi:MAG: sigma 54-interacting transcriptional regulator [Steroidobacteraceae bacterium]
MLDFRNVCDPSVSDGRGVGFQSIATAFPEAKLIAVVEEGRRDQAAQAIHLGASDFYHLPVESQVLPLIVRRALRIRELEAESRRFRTSEDAGQSLGLMGSSDSIRAMLRTLEKVAPTDASVLLLGESGTGKELLAKALHKLGPRAAHPFCAINCAAIPDNLLESELFGHEKGAFTGAIKQTQGRLELAAGGTIFLDEIGEMSPTLQAKLLRVIQERVVERVGGRTSIPLDFRLVCATHRDLPSLMAAQKFREDLYYRISEVTIRVPPLRERDGDALLLARYFLQSAGRQLGSKPLELSADAVAAIQAYGWPGNVRELENRISHARIMSDGPRIRAADMGIPEVEPAAVLRLRDARREAERRVLLQALAVAGKNLTRASALLGVTRPTLYDLLERHGMQAPREASPAAGT